MISIDRQIREVAASDDNMAVTTREPVELPSTRDDYAYVLLGDPGLGKTTVFKQESEATDAMFLSARDFLVLPNDRVTWVHKNLFIDALDETRAGGQDGRTVLDQIRIKLIECGVPRFRLSCREFDWLGNSDRQALSKIVPGKGELKVYRLELLSDADIETLLRDQFLVREPQQFVRHAEQIGVAALLRNPQTLKMLSKAVAPGSQWPESRAHVYELACNTLATESNHEHQSAKRKSWPTAAALLDAAGLIATVFLCSDRSKIQFTRDAAGDGKVLVLHEMASDCGLPVKEVLETKLFTAVAVGENAWIPAHRSIAEFLAGRYIAKRIDDGLPPSRAMSLMLGADGGVITSLRGLNAWLATCSSVARAELLEADPSGVLLYGDVKAFPQHDKVRLLRCLKQGVEDNRARREDDWSSFALGALATPDMADAFNGILRAPEREQADQVLADLVVTALSTGSKVDGVAAALLEVARDASRWSGMRRYALRTYLKTYAESDAAAIALFDDVAAGRVADADDELLGVLLRHLYPNRLSVAGALAHLRAPKSSNWYGSFQRFWGTEFLEKTSVTRLSELLDALSARSTLSNKRGNEIYWSLAGQSLVRGVEELGDDTDDERIYRWLGVTLGEADYDQLDTELRKRLHDWLEKRPARFLQLLRIAIKQLNSDDGLWRALGRLHEPTWPSGIRPQLLAMAAAEERTMIAQDLFWRAASVLYEPNGCSDLSFEKLEGWVADHPDFAEAFKKICFREIDDHRIKQAIRRAKARHEKQDRIDSYRKALFAKSPDEFNIQGLHHLALAHGNQLHEARGETPVERLQDFLGNEEILVAKAIAAIDAVVTRSDLPAADQILSSYLNHKEWLLAHPLLVCLGRIEASSPTEMSNLPESTLRAALMASYATPTDRDVTFRKSLAISHPALVAEVFSKFSIAALNAGKSALTGAHELTDDESFTDVARIAIPHVLSRYPRRIALDQLNDLARFIKKFASISSPREVLAMVASKLALKVLDVGQRTYWLATGLLLAPHKYEKRLRKWVAGNEIRIGHLGNFLDRRDHAIAALAEIPESVLGLLVELLAPNSRPDRPDTGHVYQVTPDMQRGELVGGWINDLANKPSNAATNELIRLQALSNLTPWANALRNARAAQTVVQRDAHFRFPEVSDVLSTLSQGTPANVADLHAIVVDSLKQIAAEIERSDLDIYKQFWNTDSHNNPESPKVEEAARDALCVMLRERLIRYDVTCVTEARHVDRARSDVLCSYQSFCVPIEVKAQMHPEIWKAVREQLAEKYTIDPRTGGYGVYLVFWFGAGYKLASPIAGKKPKTATELKAALDSMLSESQRKFIAICVIDATSAGRRG